MEEYNGYTGLFCRWIEILQSPANGPWLEEQLAGQQNCFNLRRGPILVKIDLVGDNIKTPESYIIGVLFSHGKQFTIQSYEESLTVPWENALFRQV